MSRPRAISRCTGSGPRSGVVARPIPVRRRRLRSLRVAPGTSDALGLRAATQTLFGPGNVRRARWSVLNERQHVDHFLQRASALATQAPMPHLAVGARTSRAQSRGRPAQQEQKSDRANSCAQTPIHRAPPVTISEERSHSDVQPKRHGRPATARDATSSRQALAPVPRLVPRIVRNESARSRSIRLSGGPDETPRPKTIPMLVKRWRFSNLRPLQARGGASYFEPAPCGGR